MNMADRNYSHCLVCGAIFENQNEHFTNCPQHRPKDFTVALSLFLTSIRELQAAYFAKHYTNLTPPVISLSPGGKKYLRVEQNNGTQTSVYCFVDKSNGDILKADGWKRPAKHARGNIFVNAGKDAITPWGVHYINNGGRR
jgi:hypothetical protein